MRFDDPDKMRGSQQASARLAEDALLLDIQRRQACCDGRDGGCASPICWRRVLTVVDQIRSVTAPATTPRQPTPAAPAPRG